MSWANERAAQFAESLAWFGASVTINGNSYPCLGPASESILKMKMDNYVGDQSVKLSISSSSFISSGLKLRSIVSYSSEDFEVYSISNDPVDPTVDFRCFIKQ